MFKEGFVVDKKEYKDRTSLAIFLKENFRKSLGFLSDDSLYLFIKKELPELYEEIIDLSKDFEHKENILTLIIFLLDNNIGIVTPSYSFKTNYDISDVMKRKYPTIDEEVKTLFKDKVLAHIFWHQFRMTNDSRYKRNYTFMLHVYENRMYDFTYYYYLFLHLAKNEVVRFTLDGVKMKSLSEISYHLSNNVDRATFIIHDILKNPFIMALMAIDSGIDKVAATLASRNSLEILKLVSTYADVDLTPIVKRKMAYWLIHNYQNYVYDTEEAKVLASDYAKIKKNLNINSLSDYVAIYDDVNNLYQRFVKLFNHNKLISFREGITSSDEFYLNYRLNDEFVCKKFLIDNNLYDETIHTEVFRETVEREVIVDCLEIEKEEVIAFKEEVLSLTKDLTFDKKKLKKHLFVSWMYLLLDVAALFGGLLLGVNETEQINLYIKYGIFGALALSLLLLILTIAKYSKKINECELIEFATVNADVSIETIVNEEKEVLNTNNKSFKDLTINNSLVYSKNRKTDLQKIKRISGKKTGVCGFWLVVASTLAMLPIFEFGLVAVLQLFDIGVLTIQYLNYDINLITLGVVVLHLLLSMIFHKHRFAYYFVYLYMIAFAAVSYFIVL